MKGWKETQIGMIPVNWDFDILSNYSEKPQYGFTESAADIGNAKFLRITDIKEIGVDWNTVPFCNCPETIIDKYKLLNNDIVFARIGATTGKSYLIKNPPHAVFASYLIRIRTKSLLFPDFLYYYFNSELYWKQINSQKGNNLKGGVNGSILGNLNIIIPPLPEQRKIAHVLSTIQKAIEQQDKLIRTTTELKKALMQKLFIEGTRGEPQKENEIGLVPESWEVVELGDICERISINVKPNKNGNTPYVGLEHIISGRLRLYNWGYENEIVSSKSKFQKDDILYGKLRPYLDKAVIASFEGICSTDILVFTGKNEIENEFLIHLFHTEKLVDYANSTTTGVQHPRTSWNSLKKIEIGLPEKNERNEITKSLNSFEDQIEILEKKKQTLTDLFKTLLHELMTGQRRVHEMEFEKIEDIQQCMKVNQ